MNWKALVLALPLAGCISTQEMQLSENIWRIQTQSGGILFVGETGKQMLKRAAELTLKQGYTHFKLADASMSSGSEVSGYTPGMATTHVNYGGGIANATTYAAPGYVNRTPTAQAGATIIMYRGTDPEANGALDAAMVLAQGL